MSKDASKIFYGPAEITLYDGSNGYLWCGYSELVDINSKNLAHKILDGNTRQYGLRYMLDAVLQQSDQALIDALVTRRATRQTIYIVGLNNMCKMSSVFLSHMPVREGDGLHNIELEASTETEANVVQYQNLLGSESQMEGPGPVGTGWATTGTSIDLLTSHLAGMGIEQRVTLGSGQYFRNDKVVPFEGARRISVSAYVKNLGAGNVTYTIGFDLLDSAGAVISGGSYDGSPVTLAASASERTTFSQWVVPSEPVASIRTILQRTEGSDAYGIDNFMTQFGQLTAWVNN